MGKIIEIQNGNIFDSNCKILVNAVNCIGIMGGGIAKAFADRYPDMLENYKEECENHLYKLGYPHLFKDKDKFICNFPTMYYPGEIAKIENISQGLRHLNDILKPGILGSIAFCALGCGIGRLNYQDVKMEISKYFKKYPEKIEIYAPKEINIIWKK